MQLKSLLPLLLLTGMIACKSKTAFNYNETIVKIERSLSANITETEDKISKYLTEGNYDSAAAVSKDMEDLVDSKLSEIEKLEAPEVKEGKEFKKASIAYFNYMKNIYASYRNYAVQTTEEARETARQKLLDLVEEKNDVSEAMQRAQRKYAEANGFKIEEK